MKIKNLVLVALILMFSLGGVSWSQTKITENVLKLDKGSSVGKAKIADLAWLAGFWEGAGLGGEVDETWTTPKKWAHVRNVSSFQRGKVGFL